jgi:hypothetical protein
MMSAVWTARTNALWWIAADDPTATFPLETPPAIGCHSGPHPAPRASPRQLWPAVTIKQAAVSTTPSKGVNFQAPLTRRDLLSGAQAT